MNEDGPDKDIYSGQSTDELVIMLKTRSDYWFNLAKIFPRLYNAGFDRVTLEEITNVDPARQNVWNVAAEVYHSLKVCCRSKSLPLAHALPTGKLSKSYI